jgi:hypothetical protein
MTRTKLLNILKEETNGFKEQSRLRDDVLDAMEQAYIKGKKEQLTLTDVSQQRELLLAYHKHLDSFNDPTIYNASESMIDDYLANNYG